MQHLPAQLVNALQLQPHPEGGFFKETYRSPITIHPEGFNGPRQLSTSIYYLLQQGDFSAFHRIASDELWHFHYGQDLLIHELSGQGYTCHRLGTAFEKGARPQVLIPAGAWFASEPAEESAFCLAGCTVAPGFDFRDFELAKAAELAGRYPEHASLIHRLCRI